jgi:hypothetical protein
MITIYLPQISHHNHAECIRLGLYIKSRNVYSLLVKLDLRILHKASHFFGPLAERKN